MVNQAKGGFMQGRQVLVLSKQCIFDLLNVRDLSFKLPGALLQLLIGFFSGRFTFPKRNGDILYTFCQEKTYKNFYCINSIG